MLGADERADLGGRVERVADPQAPRPLDEAVQELVVHGPLHVQPLPARQISPWFMKMPCSVPSSAESRSASAKTMFGDFPPSSNETRLRVGAAALITALPVRDSPVNVTRFTCSLRTRCSPAASGPNPCRTLSTPGGSTSAASSPSRVAVAGDCSAA